jgi:hypothetical protein
MGKITTAGGISFNFGEAEKFQEDAFNIDVNE